MKPVEASQSRFCGGCLSREFTGRAATVAVDYRFVLREDADFECEERATAMRILVAGSKRSIKDDQRIHSWFDDLAASIGHFIADTGHTLLLESDEEITFDYHALHGALKASESVDVEVHRLRSLKRAYKHLRAANLRQIGYGDPPVRLKKEDRRLWARVGAVAASDVVLIMGGATGTETFGSAATDLRVPLVAIPEFKGAALDWFDRCVVCYQQQPELQDLLGAVEQPSKTPDSAEAIVQFAELLAKKHGYFLGYAHEDREAADHLEVLLRRNNRVVFRDEARLRFGDVFERDIEQQLRRSDTYVGLWSRSFAASEWCEKELNWALKLQLKRRRPRRVHLVLLDDTPLPNDYSSVLHAPGKDRDAQVSSVHRILDQEFPD